MIVYARAAGYFRLGLFHQHEQAVDNIISNVPRKLKKV
jgi:hypothetical protein